MLKPLSPTGSSSARQSTLGLSAIALAAALWAAAASVASKLFDRGVEPLELVQARALLSLAGLALLARRWSVPPARERPLGYIALGLAIALVNAAYYIAIDRLAVAVAIILQYAAPVLVVAWVALAHRRLPDSKVLVALAGAVAGVVLVSEVLTEDVGRLDAVGLGAGIASAFLFATYTLLSEKVAAHYGSIGAMLRAFAVASAFWIVYQLPRGWPSALVDAENLPGVLFVGIGGTLVPFLLFVWGIQRVQAARAAIAATLEPVLAGLFAWVFLNQSLSPQQLAGGALVIVAVMSLQVRRKEAAPAPEV